MTNSKPNIRIFSSADGNADELTYTKWKFPAGEVGVRLDRSNSRFFLQSSPIFITARIQSSDDLVELMMINDALGRFCSHIQGKSLYLPTIPYARQDRVDLTVSAGESLSLKVFANVINSLGFEHIFTVDCHSDVTKALFNNLTEFPQSFVIKEWTELYDTLKSARLVSSDAGANKKIGILAKMLEKNDFIRADKKRDIKTGNILETVVFENDLKGETVAIIDDLIDFGRTFIELTKVLKAKNAGKVILYVTHGIFSGGFDHLFESGIDEIWTTNTYRTDINDPRVKVWNLDKSIFMIED